MNMIMLSHFRRLRKWNGKIFDFFRLFFPVCLRPLFCTHFAPSLWLFQPPNERSL
nr:MAG TPA: hypothetical protein [Caudoviricetes sp.]